MHFPLIQDYLFYTSNMYAELFDFTKVSYAEFLSLFKSLDLHPPSKKLWENRAKETFPLAFIQEADLFERVKEIESSSLMKVYPHKFSKDDESNYHVDFMTVISQT